MHKTQVGTLQRACVTTKPAGEGTGLWLYVSHQIVRSHGGELSVGTAERGGTRFEVWLPVDPERERD